MKAIRAIGVATVLLSFFFVPMTAGTANAQSAPQSPCIYFPATSHNVHGAFKMFLARVGIENVGDALTESFWEDGLLVQYFRKARLEYHPEYPEPFRVSVALLGLWYGQSDARMPATLIPPPKDSNFIYFPATGLSVAFAFKKFYESHFGFELLGYPVTWVRKEGNLFVQYFQRGRLEWTGIDLSARNVRATTVAQQYLDKKYAKDFKWRLAMPNDLCEDASNLSAVATPAAPLSSNFLMPPPGTALKVQVHVTLKQIRTSGAQFVEVSVDDQNSKPLPGIALHARIRSPNGERSFPLMPTDSSGGSRFNFEIGKQAPNSTIIIDVPAYWGALNSSGVAVFTTR